MFQPRSYGAFYGNILKDVRIRKRPPEVYCSMCLELPGPSPSLFLSLSFLSLDLSRSLHHLLELSHCNFSTYQEPTTSTFSQT
jgi:hypothetical protein